MPYEIQPSTKILTSSLLSPFPTIIHGFTTRQHGDMTFTKSPHTVKNLFASLQISSQFVGFQQVHKNTISVINTDTKAFILPDSDGGVTSLAGIILGVRVADCIPLLAFDPHKNIVGVAHAGWKGILQSIGTSLLDQMKGFHSDPADIRLVIGPHIGACCYTLYPERIQAFIKAFGEDPRMIYTTNNEDHIDLAYVLGKQCKEAGVLREHIDSFIFCTSCMKDMFYSFRRDKNTLEGEMLGFIGMKTI